MINLDEKKITEPELAQSKGLYEAMVNNHHVLPLAIFSLIVMGLALPYIGIPTYFFCAVASFISTWLMARSYGWTSFATLGMLLIAFSWLVNGYMKAHGMNSYLSWDEACRVPGYLLLWYHLLSRTERPTSLACFFCLSLLGVTLIDLLFFIYAAARIPWDALLYLIVFNMIFWNARTLLEEALDGSGPAGRFFWLIGLLLLWMGVIGKIPDELAIANVRQYSDSISFLGFLFLGLGYYAEKHHLQASVWFFIGEFSSLVIASAIGIVATSYGTSEMVFISWLIISCYVVLISAIGLLLAYQNRASFAARALQQWLTRIDALSRFFMSDTSHLTPEGVFAVLKQNLPGLVGLHLLDIETTIGNTTAWQQTLTIEDQTIVTLYFESAEAAEAITPIVPFLSNRIAQLVLQIRLSQEVVTDLLTGVYNRRALEIFVPTLIARLSEAQHPLSVVIADLDFFKKVNDTYGHQVGDQALIIFSQTLKRMLRAEDMIIRWGGEEFLLLLPGVTNFKAKSIIERIREAFSQQKIEPVAWPLTFSAGIAGGKVPSQSQFAEWITQADEALYRAKSKGRNRVEIFQDPPNPDTQTSETTSMDDLDVAQKLR